MRSEEAERYQKLFKRKQLAMTRGDMSVVSSGRGRAVKLKLTRKQEG